MKTLGMMLAAALLVAPVLTLNAGTLPARAAPTELQSTQSLAGTCYYYFGGRWYAYPC